MRNKVYKKDVILFFIGVALLIIGSIGSKNTNNSAEIINNSTSEIIYITELEEIRNLSTISNVKIKMNSGIYTGDILNGELHEGRYEFIDGTIFEGKFEDNLFNGKGKLHLPGIGTYEGMFCNGVRSGYGQMEFLNGDVYIGQWENDTMSDFGTYIFNNGDKYVGDFLNNKFNGDGAYTFKSDNKKYEGTWENSYYKGEY